MPCFSKKALTLHPFSFGGSNLKNAAFMYIKMRHVRHHFLASAVAFPLQRRGRSFGASFRGVPRSLRLIAFAWVDTHSSTRAPYFLEKSRIRTKSAYQQFSSALGHASSLASSIYSSHSGAGASPGAS